MPFKCFVPGCKSGYVSKIKENIKAGIRNPSIFFAPKNPDLLEEWNRLILRKDRKLTLKDAVCELHFEEECIEKNYCTLMPNGTLHVIPRVRYTLKKGSVPTIFPNLPTYESLRKTKRKGSTPLNCSSENKLRVSKRDLRVNDFVTSEELSDLEIEDSRTDASLQKIERKITTPLNCSSESNVKVFESDSGAKIYVIPEELSDVENEDFVIPEETINLGTKDFVISEESSDLGTGDLVISEEPSDFLRFSAEAENISMPNPLWSVAGTECSIIFAKWNSNYFSERRVIVCKDLSTKVFLMNVEISLSIESCTNENIAQLLQKVDDLKICSNAVSGTSSGCLGVLEDKSQKFCSICYKPEKIETKTRRKRKAHPVKRHHRST